MIQQTASERDLGVQIDDQLRFHHHTAAVLKKCKSIVAVITRSFICPNRKIITMLHKALIRPTMEYGNNVWGPSFKGDKDALEKIQRRVTKMVTGLNHTNNPAVSEKWFCDPSPQNIFFHTWQNKISKV